jgi:hypothetical protein
MSGQVRECKRISPRNLQSVSHQKYLLHLLRRERAFVDAHVVSALSSCSSSAIFSYRQRTAANCSEVCSFGYSWAIVEPL